MTEKVVRQAHKAEEVSVRLRPLKGNVSVSGQDLSILTYGERAVVLRSSELSHFNQEQTLLQKGLLQKWQIRFETLQGEPVWAVSDSATGKLLTKIKGRFLELRGENIRVDLRPAPDHLRVVATKKKKMFDLQLVGLVPLEDYIEGVIGAEVPKGWPLEALKAQAVAARSFTLAKIAERQAFDRARKEKRDWLLEASVLDQVFDHARKHEAASQAVEETKGEVLQEASGRVALALYHADCGGQTDEAGSVWSGGAQVSGARVSGARVSGVRGSGTARDHCYLRKASHWHLEISLSELASRLRDAKKFSAKGSISQIKILGKTPAGRAKKIALFSKGAVDQIGDQITGQTTDQTPSFVSGEELRQVVGYHRLRSGLFEVQIVGDKAKFTGRGFGHGVGLCQWGAKEMAASGRSYREILLHYYPKFELRLEPVPGPVLVPEEPKHSDVLAFR